MTQILKLSDRYFKITMLKLLKYLGEKFDIMNQEMGIFSKDMEKLK